MTQERKHFDIFSFDVVFTKLNLKGVSVRYGFQNTGQKLLTPNFGDLWETMIQQTANYLSILQSLSLSLSLWHTLPFNPAWMTHFLYLFCLNMGFYRMEYYSCIAAWLERDCLPHSLACLFLLIFEGFVKHTQCMLAVQTSLIAQLYIVNRWEWNQTKGLSK